MCVQCTEREGVCVCVCVCVCGGGVDFIICLSVFCDMLVIDVINKMLLNTFIRY